VTHYARRERRQLADLLLETGPDAPTLCAGWTTRDLAAHLVIRERRPDATAAGLIPPLAGHVEHVRLAKAAQPYPQIVREVRTPPWWSPLSNPLTDELVNGLEFFIHHEDVRRGEAGWTVRTLDEGQLRSIWSGVRFTSRLGLRKLGVPVTVRAPGFGEVTIGGAKGGADKGGADKGGADKGGGSRPVATIVGAPGELALFLSGRQRAASVDVEGPPETVERLRTAPLGM
jgi:uncharacterized protein (TIGR03085 family)